MVWRDQIYHKPFGVYLDLITQTVFNQLIIFRELFLIPVLILHIQDLI